MSKPTPGLYDFEEPYPGSTSGIASYNALRIYSHDPGPENDFTIAYVVDVDEATRKANAEFIVRACNAHRELLEVLKRLFGNRPVDELIGWRGLNASTGDHFQCEFCQAENLDCTLIEHTASCPVTVGRAAIAKAEGRHDVS